MRPWPAPPPVPGCAWVPLTQAKFALIDEADAPVVLPYAWLFNTGYARRAVKEDGVRKTVYLHMFLMNPPEGMEVDHRNGNTLDDRRENLRVCTHEQNLQNQRSTNKKAPKKTSIYKGVSWNTHDRCWIAQVKFKGKRVFYGYFKDELEAAKAYDAVALKHFGEFARLNFGVTT